MDQVEQCDLVGHGIEVFAEGFAVAAIRGCGDTEDLGFGEVTEDRLVGVGRDVMGLVDDDESEVICGEPIQPADDCLDGGDYHFGVWVCPILCPLQ